MMGERETGVLVVGLGRAMVAPAFQFLHLRDQRPAERDIDLLQAATDPEDRKPALDGTT
mgnify:CR=1 FL=1